MIAHPELTAEEVQALALEVMQCHLKLEVNGYKCDSAMVVNVLLKAAADGLSIDAVCQKLSGLAAAHRRAVAPTGTSALSDDPFPAASVCCLPGAGD